MPFVRFSRDRRGYEHVYLVHTPPKRGKIGRPRVLYWYRSPPGVKVGREAFDEGVRRALEQHYPDISFDWETLAAPPPPAPAVEPWRERRRLQKARKARTAGLVPEEGGAADSELVDDAEEEPREPELAAAANLAEDLLETDLQVVGLSEGEQGSIDPDPLREREPGAGDEVETVADQASGTATGSQTPVDQAMRRGRRRRRGGRRRAKA